MEILLKLPSSYLDKTVEQAVAAKGYYKVDFAVAQINILYRLQKNWRTLTKSIYLIVMN
ncbi:hypothetical protein J7J00_26700 [Bacillus sp. ISL-4]|uniref:hypothetical protein n=1 Tax=Bacillus sp. ISL-4 TaxID=2819125 RepID=UPI001BE55F68|nr:hypothetical protein [Bacillus sp. ISL-4]MBT2668983.1 hypothetical protein [Bacillus sp. ISL-4]